MNTVEIEKEFHMNRKTIRKYANLGAFNYTHINGKWDIDRESFEKWYIQYAKAKGLKYEWNRNIFDEIDSAEKAYWLGFITADGCIIEQGYRKRMSLLIGGEDRLHLVKFQNFLGETSESFIKERIHSETKNQLVYVDLCSTHLCDTLINLGIKPRKSGAEVFIKTDFNASFIRGLIDGDGYIRKDFSGIGLVGSYQLLSQVQMIFQTELNVKPHKIMEHGIIYKIEYRSAKDIFLIVNFLYGNNEVSLDRKQLLANEILSKKIC